MDQLSENESLAIHEEIVEDGLIKVLMQVDGWKLNNWTWSANIEQGSVVIYGLIKQHF